MSEKELAQRALFMIYLVNDFAERYMISQRSAFAYLSRFRGLDFVEMNYTAEHLLSMDDVVDDVTAICLHNGGEIGN